MFKLAKYYVLVNIYKRAKFSVVWLFASFVAMIMTSFVFTDLMAMANGSVRTVLVGTKWFILFSLLGLMGYHLRKIFKSASSPFGTEGTKEIILDEKRERVMAKEKLRSRSELIMDKYREAV